MKNTFLFVYVRLIMFLTLIIQYTGIPIKRENEFLTEKIGYCMIVTRMKKKEKCDETVK